MENENQTKTKIAARCVKCRSEFTEEQIKGANACPGCGDKGVPMDPKADVTVRINWHELRILTMWAENWANHYKEKHPEMIGTVFAIAGALQDQFPEAAPLTFSGEISELKKAFPKTEVKGNFTEGAPLGVDWTDDIIEDK